MNGTLKSLLAVPALWLGGCATWLMVLSVCALASGKGRGNPLMVLMGIVWASALIISIGVVVGARVALWKWLPAGAGRVVAVLLLAAAQVMTMLMEAFSVFVVFDR